MTVSIVSGSSERRFSIPETEGARVKELSGYLVQNAVNVKSIFGCDSTLFSNSDERVLGTDTTHSSNSHKLRF